MLLPAWLPWLPAADGLRAVRQARACQGLALLSWWTKVHLPALALFQGGGVIRLLRACASALAMESANGSGPSAIAAGQLASSAAAGHL